MYLLGYDIGSSSVKCSLVDAQNGSCVATAFAPKSEAPIKAVNPGWAEQNPEDWWSYLKAATADVMSQSKVDVNDINAIGISYQMHGLVCVDKNQKVLRPAIIWCDSRAVGIGEEAFQELGRSQCLTHLLNTPGNWHSRVPPAPQHSHTFCPAPSAEGHPCRTQHLTSEYLEVPGAVLRVL